MTNYKRNPFQDLRKDSNEYKALKEEHETLSIVEFKDKYTVSTATVMKYFWKKQRKPSYSRHKPKEEIKRDIPKSELQTNNYDYNYYDTTGHEIEAYWKPIPKERKVPEIVFGRRELYYSNPAL